MTFTKGAGFVAWKLSGVSPEATARARVQAAPDMPPLGIIHGYVRVLSRMSNRISEHASELHQLDLERANQRTEAKRQLTDTLADLKSRVARMTAARTRSASATDTVELAYKAS